MGWLDDPWLAVQRVFQAGSEAVSGAVSNLSNLVESDASSSEGAGQAGGGFAGDNTAANPRPLHSVFPQLVLRLPELLKPTSEEDAQWFEQLLALAAKNSSLTATRLLQPLQPLVDWLTPTEGQRRQVPLEVPLLYEGPRANGNRLYAQVQAEQIYKAGQWRTVGHNVYRVDEYARQAPHAKAQLETDPTLGPLGYFLRSTGKNLRLTNAQGSHLTDTTQVRAEVARMFGDGRLTSYTPAQWARAKQAQIERDQGFNFGLTKPVPLMGTRERWVRVFQMAKEFVPEALKEKFSDPNNAWRLLMAMAAAQAFRSQASWVPVVGQVLGTVNVWGQAWQLGTLIAMINNAETELDLEAAAMFWADWGAGELRHQAVRATGAVAAGFAYAASARYVNAALKKPPQLPGIGVPAPYQGGPTVDLKTGKITYPTAPQNAPTTSVKVDSPVVTIDVTPGYTQPKPVGTMWLLPTGTAQPFAPKPWVQPESGGGGGAQAPVPTAATGVGSGSKPKDRHSPTEIWAQQLGVPIPLQSPSGALRQPPEKPSLAQVLEAVAGTQRVEEVLLLSGELKSRDRHMYGLPEVQQAFQAKLAQWQNPKVLAPVAQAPNLITSIMPRGDITSVRQYPGIQATLSSLAGLWPRDPTKFLGDRDAIDRLTKECPPTHHEFPPIAQGMQNILDLLQQAKKEDAPELLQRFSRFLQQPGVNTDTVLRVIAWFSSQKLETSKTNDAMPASLIAWFNPDTPQVLGNKLRAALIQLKTNALTPQDLRLFRQIQDLWPREVLDARGDLQAIYQIFISIQKQPGIFRKVCRTMQDFQSFLEKAKQEPESSFLKSLSRLFESPQWNFQYMSPILQVMYNDGNHEAAPVSRELLSELSNKLGLRDEDELVQKILDALSILRFSRLQPAINHHMQLTVAAQEPGSSVFLRNFARFSAENIHDGNTYREMLAVINPFGTIGSEVFDPNLFLAPLGLFNAQELDNHIQSELAQLAINQLGPEEKARFDQLKQWWPRELLNAQGDTLALWQTFLAVKDDLKIYGRFVDKLYTLKVLWRNADDANASDFLKKFQQFFASPSLDGHAIAIFLDWIINTKTFPNNKLADVEDLAHQMGLPNARTLKNLVFSAAARLTINRLDGERKSLFEQLQALWPRAVTDELNDTVALYELFCRFESAHNRAAQTYELTLAKVRQLQVILNATKQESSTPFIARLKLFFGNPALSSDDVSLFFQWFASSLNLQPSNTINRLPDFDRIAKELGLPDAEALKTAVMAALSDIQTQQTNSAAPPAATIPPATTPQDMQKALKELVSADVFPLSGVVFYMNPTEVVQTPSTAIPSRPASGSGWPPEIDAPYQDALRISAKRQTVAGNLEPSSQHLRQISRDWMLGKFAELPDSMVNSESTLLVQLAQYALWRSHFGAVQELYTQYVGSPEKIATPLPDVAQVQKILFPQVPKPSPAAPNPTSPSANSGLFAWEVTHQFSAGVVRALQLARGLPSNVAGHAANAPPLGLVQAYAAQAVAQRMRASLPDTPRTYNLLSDPTGAGATVALAALQQLYQNQPQGQPQGLETLVVDGRLQNQMVWGAKPGQPGEIAKFFPNKPLILYGLPKVMEYLQSGRTQAERLQNNGGQAVFLVIDREDFFKTDPTHNPLRYEPVQALQAAMKQAPVHALIVGGIEILKANKNGGESQGRLAIQALAQQVPYSLGITSAPYVNRSADPLSILQVLDAQLRPSAQGDTRQDFETWHRHTVYLPRELWQTDQPPAQQMDWQVLLHGDFLQAWTRAVEATDRTASTARTAQLAAEFKVKIETLQMLVQDALAQGRKVMLVMQSNNPKQPRNEGDAANMISATTWLVDQIKQGLHEQDQKRIAEIGNKANKVKNLERFRLPSSITNSLDVLVLPDDTNLTGAALVNTAQPATGYDLVFAQPLRTRAAFERFVNSLTQQLGLQNPLTVHTLTATLGVANGQALTYDERSRLVADQTAISSARAVDGQSVLADEDSEQPTSSGRLSPAQQARLYVSQVGALPVGLRAQFMQTYAADYLDALLSMPSVRRSGLWLLERLIQPRLDVMLKSNSGEKPLVVEFGAGSNWLLETLKARNTAGDGQSKVEVLGVDLLPSDKPGQEPSHDFLGVTDTSSDEGLETIRKRLQSRRPSRQRDDHPADMVVMNAALMGGEAEVLAQMENAAVLLKPGGFLVVKDLLSRYSEKGWNDLVQGMHTLGFELQGPSLIRPEDAQYVAYTFKRIPQSIGKPSLKNFRLK